MTDNRDPIEIEGADLVTRVDDDAETKAKPSTAKTPAKKPRTPKRVADLEGIRDHLRGSIGLVGGSMMVALPITGRATVHQAPEITDALIEWGKTSPRVAKTLLSASKVGGAFGFATAMAPVVIAALTEIGVMSPDTARVFLPQEVAEFLPKVETPEVPEEDPIAEAWDHPGRHVRNAAV